MSNTTEIELIATTTFGLEAPVKKEVKNLGYTISSVENGRVSFLSDLKAVARANIHLKCAERVLLKMGEFMAFDFDELYEKTYQLDWDEWLPLNAEFPVQGVSVKSKLHSVPTCQSIVKKAVVDKLKKKYNCQWFDEDGPLYTIKVSIHKNKALLTIDTSGDGLHKRGYRQLSTDAPLQETLAAAMIDLSRWNSDRILLDPFCGSGTIAIEAAMKARNIAPGLMRSFASEKWPIFTEEWKNIREKANSSVKKEKDPRLIMGYDIDKNVVGIARYHARQAGVDDIIHFQQKDFNDFQSSRKYGYIISNPPYGERLENTEDVENLYKKMGEKLKKLDTWSLYFLTSHKYFEKLFGKEASKRRKLYNGGLECQFYQYYGPRPQ